MNGQAADRIGDEGRAGRHVLVVTADQRETDRALDAIAQRTAGVENVRRAKGRALVTYTSGGTVHFTTPRSVSGGRGLSVDVLAIDTRVTRTRTLMANLLPCLATSPAGTVVDI